MKCLVVCQPYTELIFRGEKTVENRNYPTSHRGPLLILAGKSREWLDTYSPLPDRMDFGAIVGIVDVVACMQASTIQGNAAFIKTLPGGLLHVSGPWCFILRNPRRFITPIPYRGKQMFFDVPNEVVREALKGKT